MTFLKQKKGIAALAAVAVVAVGAMGAFAYFTSTGSGSGQATVGTSSSINLSSSSVGPLYPGSGSVPVTVNMTNPGTGSQYVGTVSGTVADNGSCLGSWFTVNSASYNAQLAGGASDTVSASVQMDNAALNQDACKNQTVTINWTSN